MDNGTQVEVPDGKSICPDPDERTKGLMNAQFFCAFIRLKRVHVQTFVRS